MAKNSDSGFLEQHAEKFVLATAVILLLVMLYTNVLSSSNSVEVIAPTGLARQKISVPPSEVDATLDAAAQAIGKRAQDKPASRPWIDSEALDRLVDAQLPGNVVPPLAMGVPMPSGWTVGPAVAVATTASGPTSHSRPATKVTLAALQTAIPAPQTPRFRIQPELTQSDMKDYLVAHVAAVFPWDQLKKNWSNILPTLPQTHQPLFVVLRVEAQVQEESPDGAWQAPRTVQTTVLTPNKGDVKLLDFTGANLPEVRQSIAIFERQRMPQIVEPDFSDVLGPQGFVSWRIHLPYTEVSDIGEALPPPGGVREGEDQPMTPTPAVPPPPPPSGLSTTSGEPPPKAGAAKHAPAPGKPAAQPAPAKAAPPVHEPPPESTPVRVPPIDTQLAAGKLLVWFHDASLRHDTAYRYRLRLVMLNPIYGQESEFDQPGEAKTLELAGPWSDWSERDSAPREMQLFATGASEPLNAVSFTVFTRKLGQWVMSSFSVTPGQQIGGMVNVDVYNFADNATMKVPQNFQTNCTLVWADFESKVYRGLGGVPTSATEVVFVDEKGKLHTRVVELDKASKAYTDLLEQVRSRTASPPSKGPK